MLTDKNGKPIPRDITIQRRRIRGLLASVFPNWSEFQTANFGNLLADLFAWSTDLVGVKQFADLSEAFVTTATQRQSLLKIAVLLGYTPVGAAAATTQVAFTATNLGADCVIPAGTVVETLRQPNPISFQTLADVVLPGGSATVSASVAVENSTSVSESFVSTALPDSSIVLGQTPYLDGSLQLSTPQGGFTEVPSFVNSGPTDKVFVVIVDNNDAATVQFGDGVTAGLIPTGTIACTYKTGGGAAGNAGANSIQSIPSALTDIHGGLASVTCNNANAATGGADREGAESIRHNAPQSITAPRTSVARTDFEIHSRAVPGVDRAIYLTSNEDGTIPANQGTLSIVVPGPSGPDFPSEVLVQRVTAQFKGDAAPFPMMATQALAVVPAPFLDLDVRAVVYLKKAPPTVDPVAYKAAIAAAVRANLAALFATKVTNADGTVSDNPLIDFGFYLQNQSSAAVPVGLLAESDVANAVRDTSGVRELGPRQADFTLTATRKVLADRVVTSTVTQSATRQDVLVAQADFPRLGTVTLVDGDTGLSL